MTPILRPITNRDAAGQFQLPADGYIMVVPRGEWPHPESGLVQVVDDASLQHIANSLTADRLIDFDHFSYDPDKSSQAAGWFSDHQIRADGLWVKPRWSDEGQRVVANGRYRYASPVWLRDQVEELGDKRVRPLAIDTLGLTNSPNIKGMVPLTNREKLSRQSVSADPADETRPKTQSKTMKSLLAALGLSADASEQAALTELTKITNRIAELEKAGEPIKNRVAELEAENKRLTEHLVEQDIERFKNRIKPDKLEAMKAALLKNRAGTIEILEGLADPAEPGTTSGTGNRQPMHNRAATKTPTAGAAADPAATAQQAEAAIQDYRLANRCSYEAAWNVIRRKQPELFGITANN